MKAQWILIGAALGLAALPLALEPPQGSPIRRLPPLTGGAPRAGDEAVPPAKIHTRDVSPPRVGRSGDRERSHEMPKVAARPKLGTWKLKKGKVQSLARAYQTGAFAGPSGTAWVPADPSLAVGPNHVVVVTNSKMTFFDKASGRMTFEGSMDPNDEGHFLEPAGVRFTTFDPRAIYDKEANRFILAILEEDHDEEVGYFVIAISDDSDPHGNWNLYRIPVGRTIGGAKCWADYPTMALSKDYLWSSFNMFDFGDEFVAPMVLALPKAQIYKGESVKSMDLIDTANPDFTMQLAPSLKTGEYAYSISTRTETSAVIHRLRVENETVKADQIESAVPEITFGRGTGSAPQPGVSNKINVILYRVLSSSFHEGKLAGILMGYSPEDPTRSVARWHEWDVSKWPEIKMTQYGDVSEGTKGHAITAALAYNKAGSLGIVLGSSSKEVRPSVYLTGRVASDSPGSMGALLQTKLSDVSYHGGSGDMRWGDYFGIQPDPVDDETFWGVGQISVADPMDPANLTTWAGWVASWKVGTTPPNKKGGRTPPPKPRGNRRGG